MVAGVSFFAAEDDEVVLLDYLGEPAEVQLFPWGPVRLDRSPFIGRSGLGPHRKVGILRPALGDMIVVRPQSPAFGTSTKSGILNRINWQAFHPSEAEGLVDWDRTPALLWTRGLGHSNCLALSGLGSQATSMAGVSPEFALWVQRCMSWVRRRGQKVWEWKTQGCYSQFDVELPIASTVYALPGALSILKSGGQARIISR